MFHNQFSMGVYMDISMVVHSRETLATVAAVKDWKDKKMVI